jgi:hypothetical protein
MNHKTKTTNNADRKDSNNPNPMDGMCDEDDIGSIRHGSIVIVNVKHHKHMLIVSHFVRMMMQLW